MNKRLQQKLYDKYPSIFVQKDLPMSQTCMCWGITCGNGWYRLLDTLCSNIVNHMKYQPPDDHLNDVQAVQVKEKFGGLRFYYDGGDNVVRGLVDMTESMSYYTCEDCGNPGVLRKGGWLRTLCFKCNKKYLSKLK